MPRGRAAATAEVEETEVEAAEPDYTVYATKPLTPTMLDYAEWVGDNVGDIAEMEPERLIALGPTLYHQFQASDFNKERKEVRRAERAEEVAAKAAAKEEETEEEEAPKPKPRGRAAATTSTSSVAKAPARGKAAASAPAKAPARGRGRAPAGAAAPF